jgi:uncharacterized protein (TIGR04255 family)
MLPISDTPKLDSPPIIEVVCGVFFGAVDGLDPVFVGAWWRDIEADYPGHSIQPAVTELPVILPQGALPIRSWLISADDEWVVQVQPDRFYVNWRKRGRSYPRFSSAGGVLERAMSELGRFRAFCRSKLRIEIAPSAVELAKVDLVVENVHWKGQSDLGKVLPVIADVGRATQSSETELGLRVVQPRSHGVTHLSLSLSTDTIYGGKLARAVKIEARCTRQLRDVDDDAIREAFAELNADANDAFFGLVEPNELSRFGARKSTI